MMDRLLSILYTVTEDKNRHDDDFVDRLSRTYTSGLFIVFALIVSCEQFVGEPISCWVPAHFTDSHRSYTNNVCWVSNTFYLPFRQPVPGMREQTWKERETVSYYQWIPLILLCQASLSFMPALVWRFLHKRSGLDMSTFMESAMTCQRNSCGDQREKTFRYVVNRMDRYLVHQREFRRGCLKDIKKFLAKYCFFIGGKRHGNYLMFTYLIVKLLYLGNSVGQLFLLDIFLGVDYSGYGIHIIGSFIRGEDWTASKRFPRITLCNFEVRHQGARVHDYIVQCAISINLFNEKIFIVIWFWLVFISAVTTISLLQWFSRAVYWPEQQYFIKKKLKAYEVQHRARGSVRRFVQYYLRRDGLFLFRLISKNVSEMVATEILAGLWYNYGTDHRHITTDPARSRFSTVSNGASGSAAHREMV